MTTEPPDANAQRRQYQAYALSAIESYKNSVARDDLLAIGDEAVREIEKRVSACVVRPTRLSSAVRGPAQASSLKTGRPFTVTSPSWSTRNSRGWS